MVDFSNLNKPGKPVVRFTFQGVSSGDGEPWVDVARADSSNKPYFNAFTKKNLRNRQLLRMSSITADQIEQSRNQDRDLYSKFIIKGWGNVVEKNGQAVEFSEDNCKQFLDALPYWLFDELRDFASRPDSFEDDAVTSTEEVEGN